ncbi:hypothetical protein [Chlamydia pneumoniae]|uniref:hypothetical protein n=1 Tax=Chlamydia pneumoniae TaxID=83558 RepID=UPI000624D064|nr:hypothetical protein [Chlamydia pneumoniae]CRI44470.1 Uncharacterized protein CPn_0129/CPn_0130/CP_0642/CPj0130/CpB0131 [Chlamydia pneumoniae]
MVKCSSIIHENKKPAQLLPESKFAAITKLSLAILSLFLGIAACILIALSGLLPDTLLIIALSLISIIVLSTGISLLIGTQCSKSVQKDEQKPKSIFPKETPSLDPWLLNPLKNKIQSSETLLLDPTSINLKNELFFPSFEEWKKIFLKDPDFLIKSALANWKILEQDEQYILSHIHMDPRIFVTSEPLQKTYQKLQEKHVNNLGIASQVSLTDLQNKTQYENNLIETTTNEITYYFPVVHNPDILRSEWDPISNQLYLIFKKFFIHYHNLFSTALERNQILLIDSLNTGSSNPIARQMELLAFLCVFEQLDYNEDEYTIEPRDYFNRFVYKNSQTAPQIQSFGLLHGYEEMSYASNNIRNVLTHSIVLCSPILYQLITEFDTTKIHADDFDCLI